MRSPVLYTLHRSFGLSTAALWGSPERGLRSVAPCVVRAALRALLHGPLDAAGCTPIAEPDNVGSLCGGFVLTAAGEHLVRPSCCCDLGNIEDLKQAADCRQPDWCMLWIGHPWVSTRFEASQLWISDYHEGEPTRAVCRFRPEALQKAIQEARATLERLSLRLEPHVTPHMSDGSEVRRVCRRIAGIGAAQYC
ncbi:MAG: hypothetical protein HY898_37160 [Deltaproteobacteria bacterium]|nr:hypothetical protein [Deltaproteobacteria bacterium]